MPELASDSESFDPKVGLLLQVYGFSSTLSPNLNHRNHFPHRPVLNPQKPIGSGEPVAFATS
jgi:hypothetical protein